MKKEIEKEIGIYADIYPTGEKDKYGQRICHAKCKICNTEVYKAIDKIRNHNKVCNHVDKSTVTDIGIYTNIHISGNINKSGHKLYFATCSICNTVVEKTLSDLKESNQLCRHKAPNKNDNNYKVNDMPKGWMNKSELNMRIYYLWKSMINRTTEKFWNKCPTYAGTTVANEWRFLSTFVNDIKKLDGYEQWSVSAGKMMMLDKDTIIQGNKHYSKDTCRFITHTESNQDVFRRHPDNLEKARDTLKEKLSEPVRFTKIETKETIDFPSLKEACRTLSLNLRNAWMVLSDKYPGHHTIKGWSISKI